MTRLYAVDPMATLGLMGPLYQVDDAIGSNGCNVSYDVIGPNGIIKN